MYGNDYAYARTRVEKTILTLSSNGQPVFIDTVDEVNGDCVIRPLSPKNAEDGHKVIKLNALNFKPPRLGYCNTQGYATYISRIPMRRDWKQGLRRENMHSNPVNISDIPYKDIQKCISGEYPSMIEVFNHLGKNKNLRSMAFHRHWAMDNNFCILYKHNNKVGKYNAERHQIELDPDYHHLMECLQESL